MHKLAATAILVCLGCNNDGFPEPPDITALEHAYAAPTASVNDPAQLGSLATGLLAIDRALGRGDTVIDGSAGVLVDPGAPSDPAKPLPFDLRGVGVAQITHVCPGWAEHEARRADLTGQLELSVRFELGQLVPVLWGIADRCAFQIEDRRVMVDGDLIVAKLGRGVLFALTGALVADQETLLDDELDFVVHAGGVDYRREIDGGHVLITIDRRGGVIVHAVNGDFRCDLDRCTAIEPGGSR